MLDPDDLDCHRWPLAFDSATRIVGVLLVHLPTGIGVVVASAPTYSANRELAERRLEAVVAAARALEAAARCACPEVSEGVDRQAGGEATGLRQAPDRS